MRNLPLYQLLFILVIAAGTLALPACSSTDKLNAPAPAAATTTPVYQPTLSSVTVPVSIPISAIEQRLNQELKGILYKDESLEGDNVAVIVTKNGLLQVRADQDKIYFSMPLHIYAKGRWKWDPCKLCPSINKTEDTRFDMVIKTESKVGLTDDYKISTSTSGDFAWGDTKPMLQLGPLTISLARFVEPAMRKQMALLTKQLDKELQNRLNIRQYVTQAWLLMQEPVKLDNNMNAWLTIVPQQVRIAPLQARNGTLSTRIGISSYIGVTTNGKPNVQVNKNLPRLITDSRMSDDIRIGLTATIPYAHASKLLHEQVTGKTYTFDDGKSQLTIQDAAITPGGEQLVLMLDVNGKTKAGLFTKKIVGKVYLRGTPYYDAATASIRVRDVDYDLDTKDKLLTTASWLAKNKFTDMIQEQVSFPVQHQLSDAKKMLQTALDKQGRVNESLLLQGTIQEITPDNIYLTPEGIKAVVNATGKLTATVDRL